VLDGDPVPRNGHCRPPPHFLPMSFVAKRSPISATAELLTCTNGHPIRTINKNSSGDEITNVNFFYDNIVHIDIHTYIHNKSYSAQSYIQELIRR